ncbi:zinc-binding alcohol dehydrogenase family protein [Nonomuraea sp. NPDC050783]|uniref:quinone oxidoreductase family protein n=1 Tax=Nonomuraea sp. NPDC050783 TaxID=3154634 RepID=UPI003466BCDE
MRVVRISRFGGPEVLEVVEAADPVPGPGEVVVEVAAAGVNYADLSRAAGSYGGVTLPFVLGSEVVGRTPDGRRVVAFTFAGGGFAERAVVPATEVVEIPEEVGDGEALAMLVQGLTAWHLLRGSARLGQGESVVVNAAAGGVGSLAVQLAREFGAGRVIAAASTEEKRALALELGADAAVDSEPEGYSARVRQANQGRGADVVLDANGGAALAAGLDALAQFGRLVSYGNASRQGRPPVDAERLAEGNLTYAGFWLRPALTLDDGFRRPLTALLDLVAKGRLRVVTGAEYPLADAGRAFADIAARRTTGKVVLRVR